MTELQLLQAIGYAQDAHILDADEMPAKRKIIPFKAVIRTLAAMLAVVLAIGLFLQTPAGVAAVEVVKEQFEQFLDILFPPKDETIYVEGVPETVHVEAQGREPEADTPGFSIYVDTESYAMTEENGVWFIRPIETNPDLPPIEMQITEVVDKAPVEMAEEIEQQMKGNWETVSNIQTHWLDNKAEVLAINASKGTAWDSVQEDHRFIDNLQGGTYHVVIRYFVEASEGAGVRLHNMLKSFTILAPQDVSQYHNESDVVVKAMQEEIAYAREQDSWQSDAIDRETAAIERNDRWLDVHQKLWDLLHRSLDRNTYQDLIADQLNWGAQKQTAVNLLDLNDRAAREEENAKWVMDRCDVLLGYLDGSATPAPRLPSMTLDPEPMVREFGNAYFSGDRDTIQAYLADTFMGEIGFFATGTEAIQAIKGLDNIPQDMADRGYLNASIEFRPTADSDSYSYLSLTLVWENNRWAVASYGLEG